jgi:hypothetical protein
MSFIKKIVWYTEVIFKLGVFNVLYIFYYRLSIKTGYREKLFQPKKIILEQAVFYSKKEKAKDFNEAFKSELIKEADLLLEGKLKYYSYHLHAVGNPPNWFLNPFNQAEFKDVTSHWTRLKDFDNSVGDIKNIWEASRFGWATTLSRAYAVTSDEKYLNSLNDWILDWTVKNPLNIGPNWKCGQETSFRVFSLLTSALLLKNDSEPSVSLIKIIKAHLERIELNINYAIAQNNNHGTSEAAAIYIGNSWLAMVCKSDKLVYQKKAKKGKKLLEKLIQNLVYEDGSFSQHSINYHRVFIDTLSYTLFWTKQLSLQSFSANFYSKISKSLDWYLAMVDESSGDCPNFGGNDGALILNIQNSNYRDFRPSIQTFMALLKNETCFADGSWDETLYWFGIDKKSLGIVPFEKKSKVFSCGSAFLEQQKSWALLRFPFYKFRPTHNDALHFDLWYNGKNVLMDSGSYSYNPGLNYTGPDLKSVHAHNTISFDNAEQMPRLGRFLLAKWIKPKYVGAILNTSSIGKSFTSSYKDYRNNFHQRTVSCDENVWEIIDEFSGSAKEVTIGFNFEDENYILDSESGILKLSWGQIHVSNSVITEVKSSIISKYYWHSTPSKRLVIKTKNNSKLTVKIVLT